MELSMTILLQENESSMTFLLREWKFCDIFSPWNESTTYGTFIPMLLFVDNDDIVVHLVFLYFIVFLTNEEVC